MILSVLIPSVPSRREMALALYDSIAKQAEGLPVEILLLLDNKQRSIGKKREALVKLAQGEYVAFVDDDDVVLDGYVTNILRAAEVRQDVILFDSLCTINDGPAVRVRHGASLPNQEYNPSGFTRGPWHIHAWRRDFVLPYSFPDINYGEDWGWCSKFVDKVIYSCHACPGPLYHYRYSSAVSEAA